MEMVAGHVLLKADAVGRLGQPARHRAGTELAWTLARLQGIDLEAASLGDLIRKTPYVSRQMRRWRGQWEASRTRDLPIIDELADRLTVAAPPELETVLVHGDYRLDNLVIRENGAVAAILDWELCSSGPPLADIGLALAYWREASEPVGLFPEAPTALPGFPTAEAVLAAYGEASGRDLGDTDYFIAFAYWKIAIIVEGVHRRWLNDPANGAASAAGVGASVPRLAERAAAAAQRAGI
jgi:aminoglycoside phosphotransferase (APT) family kinase protein